MSRTSYCPRHPDTETALRCGKCDTPVCPRCLVHTPVGVRCRECAQLRRLPTFDVSWPLLARAAGVGLVTAVALGIVFVLLGPLIYRVPFLDFLAMVLLGYGIGEAVSLSVNRRRGRSLKWVAGLSVLAAYLVITLFVPGILATAFPGLFTGFVTGLLALAIAIYVAVSRF